ncbi:MAG: glycosyltransferase family 4 protein [Bacteroidales bacterium]
MAFELARRGHNVTVLTGIPNYPSGRFLDGYGLFSKRTELINGVKVIRAFLLPRGKGGGFRLALNYFSWVFFASIRALFLAVFNRYDVIIGHEPSPITQGIPAIVVKRIQKIPFYFWVLDLWPESLESAGGVTNKSVLNFFLKITQFVYNNSDKILISSRGFAESILEKGDYQNKLVYFPNWGEDIFTVSKEYHIPPLQNGFKVMFAGNIGEAQDMDNIMNAALELKGESDIKFVIIGDGRKLAFVKEFVHKHQLQDSVSILGRFPLDAMPSFFKKADVMLVTLKDEMIFNVTIPAKVQAYMAAGRPIAAMLNGEGAAIITEAQCGVAVNAGDYLELAQVIRNLRIRDQQDLKRLGLNGRAYFDKYFTLNHCMNNLENIVNKKMQCEY